MKKVFIHISVSILFVAIIFAAANYRSLTKWLSYNLAGEVKNTTEINHKDNSQPEEHQSDRIQIPKIGVNAPVIYNSGITEQEIVDNLNTGVVFYNNSSLPDKDGLAIYFGHSSNYWWRPGQYDTVFSLIPELASGDQIDVYYDGRKYVHQVTNKKIINQQAWSQLQHSQIKNGLALVTCWPLGTTWRRYVVWAEEISNQTH